MVFFFVLLHGKGSFLFFNVFATRQYHSLFYIHHLKSLTVVAWGKKIHVTVIKNSHKNGMREYLNKIVYNTNEGVFKAIVVKLYQVSHKCPHFIPTPHLPKQLKYSI